MRILINGAACEGWGRKEDSDVRFSKHVGPSEGRVLSAEEAKTAAERATEGQREKLVLWSAAIFLVTVVIAAIIGGGDDGGSPALKILGATLVAALVIALFVGINLWTIGARAKERRARLSGGGRLPPAGASVTFDETAFTLDNAVIPWASLTVERLIVIETGGEDTTDYHVERIEAADGDRTQLFDLYLYSNGDALVRMAYLKLVRERLPVLKH
jgi:hypothetical protein